jgi:hypothetical protein
LLVEVPLPWAPVIEDTPFLTEVSHAVRSVGQPDACPWRIQAVLPESNTDGIRLTAYSRPPGPFVGYARSDTTVERSDLTVGALELMAATAPKLSPSDPWDLLVCTHGTRDVCCGGLGTRLWNRLSTDDRPLTYNLRRSSHLGGHRFAPTAIDLPSGTCWAWLDESLVSAILLRDAPVTDLLSHYRGNSLLESIEEQVTEKAIFAEVGWSWLTCVKSSMVLWRDGPRTAVAVVAHDGNGDLWRWRGITEATASYAVRPCRQLASTELKHQPVVELRSLDVEEISDRDPSPLTGKTDRHLGQLPKSHVSPDS